MMTTTLRRIRAHSPCTDGWKKLLADLGPDWGEDDPIPFARIVAVNGLDDALWCCRAEPQHAREWRLYAVWCARQVQHLMTDQRSIAALDVAERYACGRATIADLEEAQQEAMGAASDSVVDAAAWAATRAAEAASAAMRSSAAAAAYASAEAARRAAEAMRAAWPAEAARAAQKSEFLRLVTETEART